jgi:hypothetical protein
MRKILFVAAAFALMTIGMSCSTQKQATDEPVYGVSVQTAQTLKPETLTVAGLDSLLKTDKLPRLAKWTKSVFQDDETNVYNVYRTLYDQSTYTIYTLKELNTQTLVLTKRRLKTSK